MKLPSIFGGKDDNSGTPASSSGHVTKKNDLGRAPVGNMALKKGDLVTIRPTGLVVATAEWNPGTDYDLYALVLFTDGHVETVSQFGTIPNPTFTPSVANGAVKHLGDVGRMAKGNAKETIEIRFTPEIAMVVPVAYSARNNGTGSFRRYGVSLGIDNGAGTQISINANDANADDTVYTVVIGAIRNTQQGVQIEALEQYSKRRSENRPILTSSGEVIMDKGEENVVK